MISETSQETVCYHCGEPCEPGTFPNEKVFCCDGCRMVYQILNKEELCTYYTLNPTPGVNQKNIRDNKKFALLDDEMVQSKLVHFKDATQSHVTFYLPQMHCSSCIWLLENLHKLNESIIQSRVNFLKKEVTIIYTHHKVSLRQVAELCNSVGYEPHISLNDLSGKKIKKYDRTRIYKIGIAGFCFGNIMLLSFPEYFSFGSIHENSLRKLFTFLNLFQSLPVFFYCASEFFISAWKGIRNKFLNIDAPIALAIVITFGRSAYEITAGTGAGYLDSMTGIVFFMLIGRFFQDKTHNTLTFNRDYTSYFPMGVTVIEPGNKEIQVPVSKLTVGQRIKIHNNEIIPADAILFLGKASIDYSFVTGESIPVNKSVGEIIYAGGRQTGGALELEIVREVSQSYLTQLWNNDAFVTGKAKKKPSFIHSLSRYFTIALFSVALSAAVYWGIHDPTKIANAVTSVLIVACPCALLLSATFTNANMLKVLQRFGFYVRNADVLERIAAANRIVFDKTGTITVQHEANVTFEGATLSEDEIVAVKSLTSQSSHPLSRAILSALPGTQVHHVRNYSEVSGMGIKGSVENNQVMLGSADFVLGPVHDKPGGTAAWISVNGQLKGCFKINIEYREGLDNVITNLQKKYRLSLISGDNSAESSFLRSKFGWQTDLLFDKKPQEKLDYIKSLQSKGETVIMTGDGLNDAGALQQSDVGISVTDNINNFSPACDVILEGKRFAYLDMLLAFAGKGKRIIIGSFIISIIYNIIGLYFAFFALLDPVVAAILMPISSISIIAFTTIMSSVLSLPIVKKIKENTRLSNILQR